MECLIEHLCRLDHLLPKDVLLALDESPQTLSPENAEMVALLDRNKRDTFILSDEFLALLFRRIFLFVDPSPDF